MSLRSYGAVLALAVAVGASPAHTQQGRPIDVCYEVASDGRHASGGPCDRSTEDGQTTGMTFDDPRSEFNGAGHFADINSNRIDNSDGPEDWYIDSSARREADDNGRRHRRWADDRR